MSNVSHLYKKGQSGNPGGMTSEHQTLTKNFKFECAKEAYKLLPLMLRLIYSEDVPPNVRINAINALMDRGFGKAIQTLIMDNEAEGKDPKMMTKAELDSWIVGDAMATFQSMVQRGEPVLLEAFNQARQDVTSNNPKDCGNDEIKIIKNITDNINSDIKNINPVSISGDKCSDINKAETEKDDQNN